jgi:hypothetical protein
MSVNDDLERRIADFYASEARLRAPDRVLGEGLATIEAVKQRRVLVRVPWRFPTMNTYTRLAVAAVAVIVVAVVGLAVLRPGPASNVGSGSSPSPSPSASPSLSPSPTASPVVWTAAEFQHPFTYVLPPIDFTWDVPISDAAYYAFRVPDPSGPGRSGYGVILRAITGGRIDPCAASSDPLPLPGGPQAVIDYLKTLPSVEVIDETPTTIGGLPAVQAFVETGPATPDCPELRPFAKQDGVEEAEVITQAPGVDIRVTVVDVAGDHVVLWTWSDQPRFYSVADALIASFRFQFPEASPSASPTGS